MAGERILIVEDESITVMDIRLRIEQLGYKPVGFAATGKGAIEQALALCPDLILMDIILKGPMDGIEAAQVIRSIHPCPIIYLTAHADQSTIDRAMATQPAGYLVKPIRHGELQAAIECALLLRDTGGAALPTRW